MQKQEYCSDRKYQIRVCLFDDHPIIMKTLKDIVNGTENMTVVGEGRTMNSVLPVIKETQPHVILLDLSMPSEADDESSTGGILPLLKQIKINTNCKTIVFSSQLLRFIVKELSEGGIKGYIYKGDPMSLDIPKAISEVHLGGIFYSKSVSKILFKVEEDSGFILTERQLELIEYFTKYIDGTNSSAAHYFNIGEETVKKHLKAIYKSLNIEGGNKRAKMLETISEMGLFTTK